MKENILTEALQKLEETIGEEVVCKGLSSGQVEDGLITLKVKKTEKKFHIEIRSNMNNAIRNQLDQESKAKNRTPLLVTRYVTPPMGEKLKSQNIQFLDTVGNVYLDFAHVFVFIIGKKPVTEIHSKTVTRAFNPTGLKVVFALLSNNELPNAPYRTIAEAANVSLGSVQWTIRDLRRLGYLKTGKREKRLENKQELFKRWIQNYSDQLRPKLIIGKFKANDPDWWQSASISDFDALWGGEVVGNMLTQNLKPELITIYTHQSPGKLVAVNRLKKDDAGNIEILNSFWNPKFIDAPAEIVHPFLVYADLVSSGDERNIETAHQIYDEKIIELIGED